MSIKNIKIEFSSDLGELIAAALQSKKDELEKVVTSCLKVKQNEAARSINEQIKALDVLKVSIENDINKDPVVGGVETE